MLKMILILYSWLVLRSAIFVECRLHSGTLTRFPDELLTASGHILIRQKRESAATTDSNYSWKPTKTPPFVTTQMKKQLSEPVLTVFPSGGAFRHGKSQEIPLEEYNTAKRVIYYSLLPDVAHQSAQPPYNPYSGIVELPPVRSNQRSYRGNNAGQNFVTRVHSAIINVSGEDKPKDGKKSNPSFTIIDPPRSQYTINGLNRPASYLNNQMTGIDYRQPSYPDYHQKPYINDFKLPYSSSLPYYNPGNNIGLSQFHYQHQSSPYYDEVEKVHASGHEHHQQHHIQHLTGTVPYQSPPFPTRHLRFPSSRYSLGSPFNDLLSSSKPFTSSVNSHPLDSSFPEHQPNLGFGDGLSTNPYGLNLNDNLGPVTMDHNLDFDNDKPLSLRNKFSNFNKFPDASDGFNSPFFKPQFSSSSGSFLGNKPLDLETLHWAAAAMENTITGDKDLHVKGSLSSNGGPHQNTSTTSTTTESYDTTPSATAFWDAMTEETQTEIPLERREAV